MDTVYVADGVARELFVPELRYNTDKRYYWYVRWYMINAEGETLVLNDALKNIDVVYNDENPPLKGGDVQSNKTYTAWLKKTSDNKSLFAYRDLYNGNTATIVGASTVSYKANKVEKGITVCCDVSMNIDYNLINNTIITEPSLSIRYKFVIEPAKTIANNIQISKNNDVPFIQRDFTTSGDGLPVNIQMDATANNYAWYKDDGQITVGKNFYYRINTENENGTEQKVFPFVRLVEIPKVTSTTEVDIWAKDKDGNLSPLLARYKITPEKDFGFMLEDENMLNARKDGTLDPRRNPDAHPELYERIGYINFDRNDTLPIDQLTPMNNIAKINFPAQGGKWLEPDVTGYAPFDYQNTINNDVLMYGIKRLQTLQNQYGLFRTAEKEGISTIAQEVKGMKYYWFTRLQGNTNSPTIYDRTYYNTNGESLGYFFYVDAANLPGRLVKIKLDGDVCQHTGLLVNFWVNDMTTWTKGDGGPLPPNINMLLIGKDDDGKETVLHRFTSGDALTDYTGNHNNNIGKWQQLMYAFTLPQSLNTYKEYYLEVQNNTSHAYGADYAIDGLRIYRTKPQIDVKRIDVCSSANLTVSTDYDILLRNMGWNLDPNALSLVGNKMEGGIQEDTKHIWKYRYGLMGNDPTQRMNNLNNTIGNVYIGATNKRETGEIKNPNDWITLNTDLKEYSNENYNNRSKVYRIIVPTENGLEHKGFQGLTNYNLAMQRQIVVNLCMVNDFLYDAEQIWINEIKDHAVRNGRFNSEEKYLSSLRTRLQTLCGVTDWDYIVPTNTIAIDAIMHGENGYDTMYEQLIRDVCSVMGISRLRVPWWENESGTVINLSAIDVNKTELKYAGERDYGRSDEVADGKYDVVIFSANATVLDDEVVDFPNKYAGSSFKDPCLLTTPFTVKPSFTVVASTKSDLPNGTIVYEGRISQLDEATVWVEKLDDTNNPTGEMSKFEIEFSDYSYTFDWFLGDLVEYNAFSEKHGVSLQEILNAYRKQSNNPTADDLITYCENNNSYNEKSLIADLRTLLLGNADTEPKMVIGGDHGKAEFRWTEWVVAIPFFPESIPEENREWLFCEKPQEHHFKVAPAPTLQVGFPDVKYPEEMEHYPHVPLRIGLPNIQEGSLTDIPIQGTGLTMGMSESNQLGMIPSSESQNESRTIYLRQGQTYKRVGELTALSAKAPSETDRGGGKFSMKFDDNADKNFAEGQTYTLYIPFGEYNGDKFVDGSCEGYATLLVKIVPEYLTWQGTGADAWYNDTKWHQSTKGELYIDGNTTVDANGNDNINNAFAPLYFTRITIPEGQTLELENLKRENNLLPIDTVAATTKATPYIQYDMAIDKQKNGDLIIAPYYINKVKEIYFKPEAQLRRQQFLTYDTARVDFKMKKEQKYWMASPLQDVFAGDMYAPKENAQQHTYAFAPIFYSSDKNDRQNPAFYQKAWDKGVTNYVPNAASDSWGNLTESDLTGNTYNVVESNWSIEYNDVNVPYVLGKGFYANAEAFTNTDNDSALVRLPKADKEYLYEPLKSTKASNLATRKDSVGRLAGGEPITIVLTDNDNSGSWGENNNIADGDGKHFLLGNPYMYPLDIEKFLTQNTNLAKKYWTLDTKTNNLIVGTPDVEWGEGEITEAIVPMQAFFVELTDSLTADAQKEITFTPDMMVGEPETGNSLRSTVTAKHPLLKLTAEQGDYRSTALLTQRDDASNGYDADKDAVILLDKELKEIPQVYTIAGTRAVGVNATRRIDQVPLGIYAGEGKDELTLTIEGVSNWAEPLYLYDAKTRKSTELTGDSHTLHLDGSSHGRYFLRSGISTGNEQISDATSISIYSAKHGEVIVSASAPLQSVQVYDINGKPYIIRHNIHAEVTYLNLPAGLYIIHATIKEGEKTEKILVK